MISCCLHHAHRIERMPQSKWAAAVNLIPETCQHCEQGGCGTTAKELGCKKVNQEYLRGQWARMNELKRIKRENKALGK